eukprot:CAMPEP_0117552460 /NCGR_PEP_ID=MMETSP0784-20121206/49718_1 /TAXON_ID=39447 /ORGANISM="" /LENGTH=48 /DNA_ID= /DNA_START= /DNA_END= /DNA_ORIENTATION=
MGTGVIIPALGAFALHQASDDSVATRAWKPWAGTVHLHMLRALGAEIL